MKQGTLIHIWWMNSENLGQQDCVCRTIMEVCGTKELHRQIDIHTNIYD